MNYDAGWRTLVLCYNGGAVDGFPYEVKRVISRHVVLRRRAASLSPSLSLSLPHVLLSLSLSLSLVSLSFLFSPPLLARAASHSRSRIVRSDRSLGPFARSPSAPRDEACYDSTMPLYGVHDTTHVMMTPPCPRDEAHPRHGAMI